MRRRHWLRSAPRIRPPWPCSRPTKKKECRSDDAEAHRHDGADPGPGNREPPGNLHGHYQGPIPWQWPDPDAVSVGIRGEDNHRLLPEGVLGQVAAEPGL